MLLENHDAANQEDQRRQLNQDLRGTRIEMVQSPDVQQVIANKPQYCGQGEYPVPGEEQAS